MTRERKVRVVPAILTDDPGALATMLQQAETFTDYVQVDIMDGEFVPSRSIASSHLASLSIKLTWEAHLMVIHPLAQLEAFSRAGARRIIFHHESASSPREVIARARELGVEVGLAINPETPVTAVLPLVEQVDSVLFLSVDPGFYGAKFRPEVLNKISELRRLKPRVQIGIDGGIKEANIAEIARSGPDLICVGSAIFLQPDPAGSFRKLQALAEEALKQS